MLIHPSRTCLYANCGLGLGCRSGSYIVYAAASTLIWLLLLTSSILSHYATTTSRPVSDFLPRLARRLSIGLRRVGKVLAACNTIWIVASCIFQFSNFFDGCWCNSGVIMWGKQAYSILDYSQVDLRGVKAAWIGGVMLAAGTATGFILFVYIFLNPRLPAHTDDR